MCQHVTPMYAFTHNVTYTILSMVRGQVVETVGQWSSILSLRGDPGGLQHMRQQKGHKPLSDCRAQTAVWTGTLSKPLHSTCSSYHASSSFVRPLVVLTPSSMPPVSAYFPSPPYVSRTNTLCASLCCHSCPLALRTASGLGIHMLV